MLGHYGRERWESGKLTAPAASPAVAAARRELPGVLAAAAAPDGTATEDKGDAVAVHTRNAARPADALERLRDPLAALAEQHGLVVEPGRFVIELRPPGADKGAALEDLAAQREPRAVMFCGDDLGDVPAFRAVGSLRAAGIPGLAVCSGSAEVTALAADVRPDGRRPRWRCRPAQLARGRFAAPRRAQPRARAGQGQAPGRRAAGRTTAAAAWRRWPWPAQHYGGPVPIRHGERLVQGIRGRCDVERVDEQRVRAELVRRARLRG